MTRHHPSPFALRFPLLTRSLPLAVLTLLFALAALPFAAFGQSATATLSGTVEDQNGAVIPGAAVTAVNTATTLERQATTDSNGSYTFPLLPPGTYIVRVQAQGFTPVENRNVVLNVGDQKALRIQLKAGNISEMIQVNTDAPLINQSPAVGTVVDRQFVENIPLNGRSFQSLIALTPGVVVAPGTTGINGEFSVNGQRTEANYYTVDGVAANTGSLAAGSAYGASGSMPGNTALGTTQSLVSIDSLQEFRMQTSSYSAEYGRTPGGQISFVTRSGSNDWHGSAFEYLRNGVLDANNWFNNANKIAKPAERQNDFGGTLGGPIRIPRLYNGKDRTFFFFSYEGLRVSIPQAATIKFVPDLCLRGVTAQCVGTDKPAPIALQPYLNAFPVPNGPENGTTGMAQSILAFSSPGSLDTTSFRIDHNVNNGFTIFGRFSTSPSQLVTRGGSFALNNLAKTLSTVKTLTVGATNLFSSHLINQFRFNRTWNDQRSQFTLDDFGGAVPFALRDLKDFNGQPTPGPNLFELFLTFGGNTTLAYIDGSTAQRQLNFVDTLSYSLEPHSLKFGVDYRQLSTPLTLSNGEVGQFTSKLQLQQNLAALGEPISQASFPIGPIYKNLSLFAQDDWRPTRRLSLSLGLRWDVNPPPSDIYGNTPYTVDQITNLATSKLAPKGTPLWETTYGNFAPRLGVAYQLRQTSGRETVIRGGFGVFYDLGNTYASQGYASGVGQGSLSILNNVPFPLTTAQLTLPPPSVAPPYGAPVYAFDPHLQLPYTLQWNGAVEQALGKSQGLTVSYVGAVARRLLWDHTVRPASSGNPNFSSTGTLVLTTNRATSSYNALQLQYQRRLSRGLQIFSAYTWSHSIDESSTSITTQQLLRASSNFDLRHNFQTAITYDVPGKYGNPFVGAVLRHWSLDTRITGRSALPFDISSGTFFDSTGMQSLLRADLVPSQPLYLYGAQYPGGRAVNFSAFTQPTAAEKAALQFGNAPRNLLRGFPAWQVDFAVRREFPIHERLKLQFRAEAFNIFNHPIFGAIQNNLTTGAAVFGRASGTQNNQLGGLNALYQVGGPRSLQFALKLIF
jgi:hypothetical protein